MYFQMTYKFITSVAQRLNVFHNLKLGNYQSYQ